MGFLDFLKRWFGSNEDLPQNKQQDNIKKKTENMKAKMNKQNNDKGFHPEILYLINKPYAEYVDFVEVK